MHVLMFSLPPNLLTSLVACSLIRTGGMLECIFGDQPHASTHQISDPYLKAHAKEPYSFEYMLCT